MSLAVEGAATSVLIGDDSVKVGAVHIGERQPIGVDLADGEDLTATALVARIDGECCILDDWASSLYAALAPKTINPVEVVAKALTKILVQEVLSEVAPSSMPKYGNPRPYLKRKKGRS
jgi:hypothetical protein